MGQSLAKLYVHMIFSTKNRESLIHPAIQDELHAYTAVILHNIECPAIQIGGTANHLHILVEQSKTWPPGNGRRKSRRPHQNG